MTFRDIEVELVDQVLVVRQNRPDQLNARTSQMYIELMSVLGEANEDPRVAAVLLTGQGRFFCSGMDFKNDPKLAYQFLPADNDSVRSIKARFPQRDPDDVTTWPAVRFIESFINFEKPLIGAVNGPAIGEGFSSLLHCDIVYAADSAYFWAPFARAGVAPEFCSTYLMPKRLGATLAHAALYLGHKIDAETAQRAGFVLEVLPADDDFEVSVVGQINSGLALAGPPELRANTLGAYKGLIQSAAERDHLRGICYTEFELIRQRELSGETKLVQQFYRKDLPTKR